MLNAGHGYEYRVFNRLFRFIGLCEINESDDFQFVCHMQLGIDAMNWPIR